MKCETLQFNLPLFSDDDLTEAERAELKFHLAQCPVCRAKHADFLSIKNDLRILSQPKVPANLANAVRSSIRNETKQSSTKSKPFLSANTWEWLQFKVMPYSVGTALSLLLTISFLYTLDVTKDGAKKLDEIALSNANSSILLNQNRRSLPTDQIVLTEEDIAALRVPVSMESPSLNPKGALIALTSSVVRGNMKDEEVTLVADVFSTGLAQIAQVVDAPRNTESLNKIENAFENNQVPPPFVPANLDRRSNDMRVIFKVIWVDVDEKVSANKKSTKK